MVGWAHMRHIIFAYLQIVGRYHSPGFWVWSDRLTVHLATRSSPLPGLPCLPAWLTADAAMPPQCSQLSSLRRWTATRPSRLLLVVTLAQSCCSGPFCYCSPQLPSIFQLPLTTCRRIRLRSKLTGLRRRRVGSACAQ